MRKNSLDKIRKIVDNIDFRIVALLNMRASKALQIGLEKKKAGMPVVDLKRERQILARIAAINKGPLTNKQVCKVYKSIIASCRDLQKSINQK